MEEVLTWDDAVRQVLDAQVSGMHIMAILVTPGGEAGYPAEVRQAGGRLVLMRPDAASDPHPGAAVISRDEVTEIRRVEHGSGMWSILLRAPSHGTGVVIYVYPSGRPQPLTRPRLKVLR